MTALARLPTSTSIETSRAVIERAAKLCPFLRSVRLGICRLADEEHQKSERQYCHVGHRPDIICHALAMHALPIEWQLGLIGHELGHLTAIHLGLEHSEEEANRLGSVLLGSRITFEGPLRLEYAKRPRWLR